MAYIRAVRTVLIPGGRLVVLAALPHAEAEGGSFAIGRDELRALFGSEWTAEWIKDSVFELAQGERPMPALLAAFRLAG